MSDVTERFAGVMVSLAEAFPQVKLREGTIRIYATALRDYTPEQVATAALRAIRECQYFPSVAELRRFIEPVVDDAAMLAWSGFQQAAARIGAWASLEVDDHCAAQALTTVFGSWPQYCAATGPEVGARRAEFMAAYRAARRDVTGPTSGNVLAGLADDRSSLRLLRGTWAGRLGQNGEVVLRPRLGLDGQRAGVASIGPVRNLVE